MNLNAGGVEAEVEYNGVAIGRETDRMPLMNDFRCDLNRYREFGESYWRIALNPAVWCLFWYRMGRVIYRGRSFSVLRLPLKALHLAGSVVIEALLQMRLNVGAKIGPGLLIAHCGGITLHPDCVIGSRCDLAHHVTLGTRGVGQQGVPRLGDGVYVGTNAVVIGPIAVGDGARIAANSLVNRDVPAYATVMGVPAQVVRQRAASPVEEVA
jgi:serine O-acetyltransferase